MCVCMNLVLEGGIALGCCGLSNCETAAQESFQFLYAKFLLDPVGSHRQVCKLWPSVFILTYKWGIMCIGSDFSKAIIMSFGIGPMYVL